MKRLFYVRHGETEMNVAELFSGRTDTLLTQNGIEQAMKVGKEIKENLPKLDLIVCSPLSRAYETAKLIATETGYPVSDIQKNALFIERSYGELEGTSNVEYMKQGSYQGVDLIKDVETVVALQKRAEKSFEFLSQLDYDNILVVAHNAFGRALRRVVNNQNYLQEYEVFVQIPNASVLELI